MIGGHIVPIHAMEKQLPLSQDVLWARRSPVVCFICLSGLLRRLRLAMTDRHVSLLHAKKVGLDTCLDGLHRLPCRACSRERAYPPKRDRLSLPLLEGPPLMDLDLY